ncbi:MAG: extracellular solute-binding protein [Alphaproteobacteria bacterium]
MKVFRRKSLLLLATAAVTMTLLGSAEAKSLRLLTWGGYAPKDVVDDFKKETGIDVEVTLSNNEEMISKLRATGGGGFDLAQPSQDRITGPQEQFKIYKPIDMTKVETAKFIPSMLEATKKNTTVGGKVYGLPHIWGTDGLVVDTDKAKGVMDFTDLCKPEYAGKVSYRLKRPTLIGFAFAMGLDPFKAYNDPKAYEAMMTKVGDSLIACKKNVKVYWDGSDSLLGLVRSGEVIAAMAWDTGGWKLNTENPQINYRAPKSGALGWVDTFAIPAGGENDDAAYKWINFVMRPDIAARIVASAGNFTASQGSSEKVQGKIKDQFAASFPKEVMEKINWYPPVPAGLEAIEGKILDRIKAAN